MRTEEGNSSKNPRAASQEDDRKQVHARHGSPARAGRAGRNRNGRQEATRHEGERQRRTLPRGHLLVKCFREMGRQETHLIAGPIRRRRLTPNNIHTG